MEVKQKTQREFLLSRPETMLGPVHPEKMERVLVADLSSNRVCLKDVTVTPAFIGIVDEILVNACDVSHREREPGAEVRISERMKSLRVFVDQSAGVITVENDGRVLPIVRDESGRWQPEIAFGVFNSSSAYDDTERRFRGGRNGLGAKGTNGMSVEFTVDIVDKAAKLAFSKTWRNNMGEEGVAVIRTPSASEKNLMRIRFAPDLGRFAMSAIDEDAMALIARRVVDCAGVLRNVSVFLNGRRVNCGTFKEYCEVCIGERQPFESPAEADSAAAPAAAGAATDSALVAYAKSDMWEVGVASCGMNDGWNMSFVNGIWTRRGGTHVNAMLDQMTAHAKSLLKMQNLTNGFLVRNCRIFVNCLVVNPEFDSQRKETLKTPTDRLGAFPQLRPAFLNACVHKTAVKAAAEHRAESSIRSVLSSASSTGRTVRERHQALLEYEKLKDAPFAGTARRRECVLILTEGDSARGTALAGLGALGKDQQAYYGVFPLKGKVLNVRKNQTSISDNKEIVALTRILGLDLSKRGEDAASRMRYGSVMLMTDQDHDGAHIKGLVVSALAYLWPSVVFSKTPFIREFITPVAQATRGGECRKFYSAQEYDEWKRSPSAAGWKIKFFKGLGTSTDVQARSYFSNLEFHMRTISMEDADASRRSLEMVFDAKREEDRKQWILRLGRMEQASDDLPAAAAARDRPLSEFVDSDLVAYSYASTLRAIPSCMDGLKPSQRKVLCTFLDGKCPSSEEQKVADLVGIVSSSMKYHHGEKSLADTITRMGQRFWCSNNVPYLRAIGNFGSRVQGGDEDCGSPRYIATAMCAYTPHLFPREDMPVLARMVDDGVAVETTCLAPVVPTALVNGAGGIGTGWSTFVPCFPLPPIVAELRRRLSGSDAPPVPLLPFFPQFKGEMWLEQKQTRDGATKTSLHTRGVLAIEDDLVHVVITELPAGVWTDSFKKKVLVDLATEKVVKCAPAVAREAEEHLKTGSSAFSSKSLPPHFSYQVSREKDKSVRLVRLPFISLPFEDYSDDKTVHFRLALERPVAKEDHAALLGIFDLENSFGMDNMHMFDPSGKIKLYPSAESIIDDYFPVRLDIYSRRLEREIALARSRARRNNDKAAFVRAVCDGRIQVMRARTADIVAGIRALGIEPDEQDPTFSYLRELSLSSFSKEGEDAFVAAAAAAEERVRALESTTPQQLWLDDLDRLEAGIREEKEYERANEEMERGGSTKRTQQTTKALTKRQKKQ
jgi:DNA topoisomerase-2